MYTDSLRDALSDYIIEDCVAYCNRISCGISEEDFVNDWKHIFLSVCGYMGINKESGIELFDANLTNWEHFHLNKEEEEYEREHWFNKFKENVFYCSDRWSVDRLIRCHWLFNRAWETF